MESINNNNISKEGDINTNENDKSFNGSNNLSNEIYDKNCSSSLVRLMDRDESYIYENGKEISQVKNGSSEKNLLDSSKNNNGNTVGTIMDNIKILGKNIFYYIINI